MRLHGWDSPACEWNGLKPLRQAGRVPVPAWVGQIWYYFRASDQLCCAKTPDCGVVLGWPGHMHLAEGPCISVASHIWSAAGCTEPEPVTLPPWAPCQSGQTVRWRALLAGAAGLAPSPQRSQAPPGPAAPPASCTQGQPLTSMARQRQKQPLGPGSQAPPGPAVSRMQAALYDSLISCMRTTLYDFLFSLERRRECCAPAALSCYSKAAGCCTDAPLKRPCAILLP